MKVNLTQTQLSLEPGSVLALTDAVGVALRCEAGRLWLTTPDQPGDHILDAGMSFPVTGRGKLVLEAMEASRLSMQRPARTTEHLIPQTPSLSWAES